VLDSESFGDRDRVVGPAVLEVLGRCTGDASMGKGTSLAELESINTSWKLEDIAVALGAVWLVSEMPLA
jgi:hypothetical protein